MKADDISTGDFLVIVRWRRPVEKRVNGGPFSVMPEHTVEVENTKHLGVPLYVLGVSLPFIAVAMPSKSVFHLDVRDVELMRSNETYFRACVTGVNASGLSLSLKPMVLQFDQMFGGKPEDEDND